MKDIRLFLSIIACTLLCLTSCDESSEPGEYDNWQARNENYIDSIATLARNSQNGEWKVILAEGLDSTKEWSNDFYVYCKVLGEGTGTAHPAFTDTVVVNYKGSLIPTGRHPEGYIFDSNYDGILDPAFDVPTKLPLSSTVAGFYTALQQMPADSRWIIYIPATLGYGASDISGIPAYSTLIFDVNLVSFYPVGGSTLK